MADHDAGSRGAEDESRDPEPGEGTKPLSAKGTPEPETTAEPGAGPAAGSGVGSAGQEPPTAAHEATGATLDSGTGTPAGPPPGNSAPPPPGPAGMTGSVGAAGTAGQAPGGYAYSPGGPGWNAPGWGAAQPARPGGRLRRYASGRAGQLIAVGLVGAVIGGGVVGVAGALWDRDRGRGHFHRVSWEERGGPFAERGPFTDGERGPFADRGDRGPWEGRLDRRFGPQDRHFGRMPHACQRTDNGFRCELPLPGQSPAPVTPPVSPSPTS